MQLEIIDLGIDNRLSVCLDQCNDTDGASIGVQVGALIVRIRPPDPDVGRRICRVPDDWAKARLSECGH
jgi:hypothetical protein